MDRSLPLTLEALLFVLLATASGLAWNALRADGLELGRNYFPAAGRETEGPRHEFATVTAAELADYLPYLDRDGSGGSGYILLDARSEAAWLQGHIPGAILCDHYHQDRYLTPTLLQALRDAALVIVYCNGGDCPDSISLAYDLVFEYGVPREAVAIYEGGWQEWQAQDRPVEKGEVGR